MFRALCILVYKHHLNKRRETDKFHFFQRICSHHRDSRVSFSAIGMESYFSDEFRLSAKRVEETEEKLPSQLNRVNSSGGFAAVSLDKLSVKYTGRSLHRHDVGVFQSEFPAPTNCIAYYFEVYVKNAGIKGQVAIGFTRKNTKNMRLPGWEDQNCSYRGDNGHIFCAHEQGETTMTSQTYTTGDIVGCGVNYAFRKFFFTKNGFLVGTIRKGFTGPLFPTVAVHSQDEEVIVNFGLETFTFDFKKYEASERKKQQMEIEKISIPPSICDGLVKTYLRHYGYEETLKAFDLATSNTVPPIYLPQEDGIDVQDTSSSTLHERKNLRELIMKGEIDAAIAKLQNSYPELVQNDKSEVCFLLHSQKFIELVRMEEIEEAVKYGREKLAKFIGLVGIKDTLEDCLALLAYKRPEESIVGYFLGETQKEVVADAVNAAILSRNLNYKSQLHSHLETLLRQLTICSGLLRSVNKYEGEAFSLHRHLNNNS